MVLKSLTIQRYADLFVFEEDVTWHIYMYVSVYVEED